MQASTSAPEVWAATNVMSNAPTRFVGGEKYLGHDDRQLGTSIGENRYELFTVTPPGEALQFYFEKQQPTFIAVHDIGIGSSAAFLAELGAALRRPLQSLTIRQQGSGVSLAVLRFIELPSPRGMPVRVYATSVDADTVARRKTADTLLAFSRLGVLLVDVLPEHMLTTQFGALRARLLTVPWNNRELLLVPRAALSHLDEHAARLTEGTVVRARSAAPASSTAGVWKAIHETWGRLRTGATEPVAASSRAPAPSAVVARPSMPASAPTTLTAQVAAGAPITLRPMVHAGPTTAPASSAALQSYARSCTALRGALGCLVFDRATQRILAADGNGADASSWISPVALALDAAQGMNTMLGGGASVVDVVSTLDRHVVVVRTPALRPDLGMAIGFDKAQANLVLLRAQLQRLDAMLAQ